MPTFTSVKSGNWNDQTVWDRNAVPANGDSVVIAAGHTVTFNVDQSSFATGLAGLTINGTLKIPSQAEDSSMPNTVVLKVNANIAGSGSFIIGSPTQPIIHPQLVRILVNGTITVANFNCYGEQRSPLWDYLAQDAAAGSTTIVLQNGLPLRAGDIIAIGRSDIVGHWSESSTARGLHTVASYNAATKTVTLNEALTHARSGTGVRACLVVLLSRQIVISKYGAAGTGVLAGSGRTMVGVLFTKESGASDGGGVGVSSSTFTNTASMFFVNWRGHFAVGSNNVINNHCGYYAYRAFSESGSNAQVNGFAFINAGTVIHAYSPINISNCHSQNCIFIHLYSSLVMSVIANNVTHKNGSLIGTDNFSGTSNLNLSNITLVDGNIMDAMGGFHNIIIDTISWYGYLANDYSGVGGSGNILIKNLTAQHFASGRAFVLNSGSAGATFVNCQIQSLGRIGSRTQASSRYIQCSLNNAANPTLSSVMGICELISLSVNAYYRPNSQVPLVADQLWTNRILVKGLTVGATSHPRAFEHIFPHGYVKNRWDAATPDYTTFDFLLTQSSFSGQPIWLEYQVFTSDPIRVTGTVTRLGTGESVKVQIFSAGKEPLYGDTPDFEQIYTATGDINVNWTPTDARTWIVRVLAYLQQTTNPITIQNLQVAGGGTGGGQTYNINVTDGITPSLSDAADIVASLMVTDSLNPTLTDQASLSAQIALSDAINPTLQDQSQAQVQVDLSDGINPTLQDIVDVASGTFYNISVSDQITPSLADSVDEQITVSVSESISPQLQDQASPSIQISASEVISPTLQEQVYEQAQISVNETITPTLQDLPTTQVDVSASETIAPTLQEQVNVTAGGTYHIVEPLDIDITEDELEV